MTKTALALAALALAVAAMPAQAHASPDPLDNEVHLLADGGDDTYAATGGLDLQDLFAREAWLPSAQEDGVVFRMVVYGSTGPGGVASPLGLALAWESPQGARSLTLASQDGLNYTAQGATVLEAALEREGQAIQGSVQVFVPASALGAARGEALSAFLWTSSVGDDVRDIAPGGRPVPGTQGQLATPEESAVVTAELPLAGPQGYTRSTAAREEGGFRIKVQNLITVTGQHIHLDVPDVDGWDLRDPQPAAAVSAAGEHPEFFLPAVAGRDAQEFTVFVLSDLGGREPIVLEPGTAPSAPPQDGGAGAPDGDRSAGRGVPAGPVALAAVAAAAAVATRRRR